MSLAILQQKFGQQVDASSLGLFRIIWGVLMTYEAVKKLLQMELYTSQTFHFTYALFPFVEPWPQDWMMTAEAWLMVVCGVAITVGVRFRAATLLYTLLYTHFFLLEKLYYNNHYYLTILLGLLLALSRADACYSVSRYLAEKRRPSGEVPTLPLWNLIVMRGQVVVLYFFGGVAKLNGDWFQGEPIRLWFSRTETLWPLSWLVLEDWFIHSVCLSGIVIDLSVGFLLLSRRTFWPAAVVLAGFHAVNSQLFPIGIFPWLAIGTLLLFVEPGWPRRVAARLRSLRLGRRVAAPLAAAAPSPPASRAVVAFVLVYLAIQIVLPLRIHAYGHNPSWTEVGQLFSWRMMLRFKDAYLGFEFDPPEAEQRLGASELRPRLTERSFKKMQKVPHLILQYVYALEKALEELGMPDVKIRVVSIASLNGRPYQLMIDPERDLTQVSYGFFEVPDWIEPLRPNQRVGRYPTGGDDRRRKLRRAVDEHNRERLRKRRIYLGDD